MLTCIRRDRETRNQNRFPDTSVLVDVGQDAFGNLQLLGREITKAEYDAFPSHFQEELTWFVADNKLFLFTAQAMRMRAAAAMQNSNYKTWRDDPSYDWAATTRKKVAGLPERGLPAMSNTSTKTDLGAGG